MHWSLKPDPDLKGSYYRRIEDVERALNKMDANRLPIAARFLVCYYGCEKLAQGIVGVHERCPPAEVYGRGKYLRLSKVKSAVNALSLTISTDDLDRLFKMDDPTSARNLRDSLSHNFGPTNVDRVLKHAVGLLPNMDKFLSCAPEVLAYQKAHFASIE